MQKVSLSMLSSSSVSGLRNLLINGGFDVWQRGTVDASTDASGFLADRWRVAVVNYTVAQTQQTFSPGQIPGEPAYHWRGVTTAVTNPGNYAQFTQAIEDVRALAGQSATVTFWAKADATRPMSVELAQNFGSGGSTSVTGIGVTKVTLTTAWQQFTIAVAVPSISGKTIGTDSSLKLNFWLGAGSDFDARTANLGHQSGTFFIARVQLEAGVEASAFEPRPFALELDLCQRYAQVLGGAVGQMGAGYFTSTTNLRAVLPLLAPMRAAPSMVTRGGSSNFTASPGALAGSGLALGTSPVGSSTVSVDLTVAGATNNAAGLLNCANAAGSILLVAELT